ncbi:hypothetical protein [Peribacillus butanolivorans]|uniref:hypothetical protein n=1 Tax=Peribacillus butanolivorans TaxID=421767 RepID=UPI003670C401
MNYLSLLIVLNCYIIFFLIYTESIQPLINRIDGKKRRDVFLVFCFLVGTVSIGFMALQLYSFIEVIWKNKYILHALHAVPYAALVGSAIPYVLFLYQLIPQDERSIPNRDQLFLHTFFIVIFICFGVKVGGFNPSDLVDTFSLFMFMISIFTLINYSNTGRWSWNILYALLGIIYLVFSIFSLSKFMGFKLQVELISFLTPYVALLASSVSYIFLLFEIKESVKESLKLTNNNITFLAALILGLMLSSGVYVAGLNVNNLENGFSFFILGVSTYLYYQFSSK